MLTRGTVVSKRRVSVSEVDENLVARAANDLVGELVDSVGLDGILRRHESYALDRVLHFYRERLSAEKTFHQNGFGKWDKP